jgi:hypothetical protein
LAQGISKKLHPLLIDLDKLLASMGHCTQFLLLRLGETQHTDKSHVSSLEQGGYSKGKMNGWGMMRTAEGFEYIGERRSLLKFE